MQRNACERGHVNYRCEGPCSVGPRRQTFGSRSENQHTTCASKLMKGSQSCAVLFTASIRALELVALPIASELSSVPELSVKRIVVAAVWPGIPAFLAFGRPVYRASIAVRRLRGAGRFTQRSSASSNSAILVVVFTNLAAAAWGLVSVIVLRGHKEAEPTSLCAKGPFRLSRHPINMGLIWTAVGFASADAAPSTVVGALLFTAHLFKKVIITSLPLAVQFRLNAPHAFQRHTDG